jgi:protein-disulfide isomerase
MSSKNNSVTIPGAILLAGIIIAIAIIIAFAGNKNSASNPKTASQNNTVTIAQAAKEVGLSARNIEACVENNDHSDDVAADEENAAAVGAQGTPFTVVVGPDGQTFPVSGALPQEAWEFLIDTMIGDEEPLPEVEQDLSKNVRPIDETDHIFGDPNAPVILIEYSDIDCPFCKRLHPVLETIVENRPDDVAWAYRHLPLTNLHPEARKKAEAVECVAAQSDNETTWEFLNLLINGSE